MAVRHPGSPLSVRLSREDREWLAKFARHEDVSVPALVNDAVWHFRYWQEKGKKALAEVLELIDLADREYDRQVRRRRYFQREYELQSRRLRNMRRAYEKQLRQERRLRSAYEKQLRRQRDYYERQAGAAETFRDALYGSTVAKLLALAVCSESDGEAKAAFAKARVLYRKEALSRPAEDPAPGAEPRWQARSARRGRAGLAKLAGGGCDGARRGTMRAHRDGRGRDTMRSAETRKRRSEALPETAAGQRMPCLIPPWPDAH